MYMDMDMDMYVIITLLFRKHTVQGRVYQDKGGLGQRRRRGKKERKKA